jgi:hypothetical protein
MITKCNTNFDKKVTKVFLKSYQMFNYCIYSVFNKNLFLRKNFFYAKKLKLTGQKLANRILILSYVIRFNKLIHILWLKKKYIYI